MSEVTTIFSDLGNVVVRFFNERTVRRLGELAERYAPGRAGMDIGRVLFDRRGGLGNLAEYGLVEPDIFLNVIKAALRIEPRLPAAEIERAWSDVFTVNEGVFALWRAAKRAGTPLVAVSDADALRIERLRRMGVMQVFDHEVFSFREGMIKADGPEFFIRALDRAGCKAEEVLYVDDLRECLDVAAGIGIRTLHYIQDRPGETARLERELDLCGLIAASSRS